jgi:hypothetical protein
MAIVLESMAGRTILFISDRRLDIQTVALLDRCCVSIAGPLKPSHALKRLRQGLACDAVIVDLNISDQLMLAVNEILESQNIAFLFARYGSSEPFSKGFTLSSNIVELDQIGSALFGRFPIH